MMDYKTIKKYIGKKIKIKFTEFNRQIESLEKEGKIKKYIKVD